MSENIVSVFDEFNDEYTPEKFAKLLNGREYTNEITKYEESVAKHNNLVVAFGASDDLLEFRGAINDEVGAYDSVLVYVVSGKVITESAVLNGISALRKYGFLETVPKETVEAVWCESDEFPNDLDASWLIKVNGFESAPFDVMEDDRLYCRGAVFLLK